MGFYLGEKAASDVRKQMKEKLPVYMVPTKLIQVDEMPLNKNGKTDRNYFKNYGKIECDVLKLITGKRIRGKDKCYERRTVSRGV